MPKTTEVFTPNAIPTYTYVDRKKHRFEERLREAIMVPNMIASLSGPSKSGKTVLVNKVINPDNLIPLSGARIRTVDELWSNALAWMGTPTERTETTGSKVAMEVGGAAGGKVGVPLIAHGKAEFSGTVGGDRSRETAETFAQDGLHQVIKEIAGSDFVLFVDDFHYIPRDVQKQIGLQIKEAAEKGVRICTALVPHRADDVVRSNPELRGRVQAIDTNYWSDDELAQIANAGFRELNVDVAPAVMTKLISESFGSPQLIQAICLNFCFENGVYETLPEQKRIEIDFVTLQNVLERTSTMTDFTTMCRALHSGPRQRGEERKEFTFTDGSKGDVYRCVLLALKAGPPQLAFRHEEILRRTKEVTVGDSPHGSSVVQALSQIDKIAATVQEAPVIEWDDDVLNIVEPYFLFFLRSSMITSRLAC